MNSADYFWIIVLTIIALSVTGVLGGQSLADTYGIPGTRIELPNEFAKYVPPGSYFISCQNAKGKVIEKHSWQPDVVNVCLHLANPDPNAVWIRDFDLERIVREIVMVYVLTDSDYLEQVRVQKYSNSQSETIAVPYLKEPQRVHSNYYFWIENVVIDY